MTAKKTKITTKELVTSENALAFLAGHPLPALTAMRLKSLRRVVGPIIDDFKAIRRSKIEQYGEKDGDGNPEVTQDPATGDTTMKLTHESMAIYAEEMNALGEKVVSIDEVSFKLSELEPPPKDDKPVEPWLTAQILEDLDWLITE